MTRSEIRQRAEDLIEQLIDILDQIDGDADLEPSLGYGLAQAEDGRLIFLCNDLEDPQCAPARPRKSPRRRAA